MSSSLEKDVGEEDDVCIMKPNTKSRKIEKVTDDDGFDQIITSTTKNIQCTSNDDFMSFGEPEDDEKPYAKINGTEQQENSALQISQSDCEISPSNLMTTNRDTATRSVKIDNRRSILQL